jgi:hypothetical protein
MISVWRSVALVREVLFGARLILNQIASNRMRVVHQNASNPWLRASVGRRARLPRGVRPRGVAVTRSRERIAELRAIRRGQMVISARARSS